MEGRRFRGFARFSQSASHVVLQIPKKEPLLTIVTIGYRSIMIDCPSKPENEHRWSTKTRQSVPTNASAKKARPPSHEPSSYHFRHWSSMSTKRRRLSSQRAFWGAHGPVLSAKKPSGKALVFGKGSKKQRSKKSKNFMFWRLHHDNNLFRMKTCSAASPVGAIFQALQDGLRLFSAHLNWWRVSGRVGIAWPWAVCHLQNQTTRGVLERDTTKQRQPA